MSNLSVPSQGAKARLNYLWVIDTHGYRIMFIERKLNPTTNTIELWNCRWERPKDGPAQKVFVSKVCDEPPLKELNSHIQSQVRAICWAYGRTLGNIAVYSQSILGSFAEKEGSDALLPCDFANSGKFRHGAARWWCRTHQTYWGTKADQESYALSAVMQCANHSQKMNYVLDPETINLNEHAEVGIWCSLPAALSTDPNALVPRPPKIHVHIRPDASGKKTIDNDYDAISLRYSSDLALFANNEITTVNVTPPAAIEFVHALEDERQMDCISCSRCGFPHLDLGDFARSPHRKHFCGNCGWDSTWSKEPIVSTPLKPLHDTLATDAEFLMPDRKIDLDEYTDCSYTIWASTPAIVWTASRPQEKGIHAHVCRKGKRVVDDTFSEVVLNGSPLERKTLLQAMFDRSIT